MLVQILPTVVHPFVYLRPPPGRRPSLRPLSSLLWTSSSSLVHPRRLLLLLLSSSSPPAHHRPGILPRMDSFVDTATHLAILIGITTHLHLTPSDVGSGGWGDEADANKWLNLWWVIRLFCLCASRDHGMNRCEGRSPSCLCITRVLAWWLVVWACYTVSIVSSGSSSFSLEVTHRFSEKARRELRERQGVDFQDWPPQGTAEYHGLLYNRDLHRHGGRILAAATNKHLLASSQGNLTYFWENDRWDNRRAALESLFRMSFSCKILVWNSFSGND